MKHTKQRKLAQDNRWVTVKPNGPDKKGRPVEIDESGRVTKGMGGKFQGMKISEVRKDFVGAPSPNAPSNAQQQNLTPKQWKEKEREAIAGLSGSAKREAQRKFYKENKEAINKARGEAAKAELEKKKAPGRSLSDQARRKGISAIVTANTGYIKGSSYDDVVLFTPRSNEQATTLKEAGAQWNGKHKVWVLKGIDAAQKILSQMPDKAQAQYAMALDRASVRSMDLDGRMHIATSNISKANVCGYMGREIPGAEKLGLDMGRTYQLLRDPEELKKAAHTFNNVPLLDEHIPVSADEPHKSKVVGSTGTDAEFDGEYLKNSLVVWDSGAIAGINTGEQKELSAAYRYVADMTPGVYQGVPYDGVMRQIVGNHVALVQVGRAGADVVVGDSLPMELIPMKIKNGMTSVVNAALCGHILPKLALDAAPIPRIKALVAQAATVEKLAQDTAEEFEGAGLDSGDLVKLLRMALAAAEGGAQAEDEDEPEELPQEGGEPDEDEPPTEDEGDEQDAKEQAEELQNGKAEKPAMDAALIAAKAEKQAMAKFNAIRKAERAVAPIVGEVAAMDSAEAVYRFAMDSVGINYKGVHPSAYHALIEMHQKAQKAVQPVRVAMDAAATDALSKIMPNAFGARK